MKNTFCDASMYPEFAKKVKECRKKLKLTQGEIANKIGCSRQMYNRLEQGYPPIMQYADKLAEILGEEMFSVFSFDVRKYSKERILIYAVIFGVSYEEIAKVIDSTAQYTQAYLEKNTSGYLLQYRSGWDRLFPHMEMIQSARRIGKNSIEVVVDGTKYVLVNQIKTASRERDSIWNLIGKIKQPEDLEKSEELYSRQ